jgi:superfamily II DNA/RNA helicase
LLYSDLFRSSSDTVSRTRILCHLFSSHASLLQVDQNNKSIDKKEKEKQEAFARVAIPQELLGKMGGYDRCNRECNDDHFALSGKMKKLADLLDTIEKRKGRVLVFSYSTQTLDIIQRFVQSTARRFLRIDGNTPAKDRQKLVNTFQKNKIFCFLLSTRAAGVGLNLTAASNVIIFDCEWNPALDEQAQDRSFRIGQQKDVTVYRLISQGTIDELKYLRQIYKVQLKQEAFRSSDGTAATRAFVGVQKDKERRGELFGMENLLKFDEGSSFMDKIWTTGDRSEKLGAKEGVDHHVLAEAIFNNDEKLREHLEGLDHKNIVAGTVKPNYEDPDEVMDGHEEMINHFAGKAAASSDSQRVPEDESAAQPARKRAASAEPQSNVTSKKKKGLSRSKAGNFEICGYSWNAIRQKQVKTTFSKADFYQPTDEDRC